jgi:GTP-binding protein
MFCMRPSNGAEIAALDVKPSPHRRRTVAVDASQPAPPPAQTAAKRPTTSPTKWAKSAAGKKAAAGKAGKTPSKGGSGAGAGSVKGVAAVAAAAAVAQGAGKARKTPSNAGLGARSVAAVGMAAAEAGKKASKSGSGVGSGNWSRAESAARSGAGKALSGAAADFLVPPVKKRRIQVQPTLDLDVDGGITCRNPSA